MYVSQTAKDIKILQLIKPQGEKLGNSQIHSMADEHVIEMKCVKLFDLLST